MPIVEQLCSIAPRLINAVDVCGRTPLHIACLYARTKVVVYLIENGATLLQYVFPELEVIDSRWYHSLIRDRDGRTPFHCAAWRGSVDCLKELLRSFSTDLNSVDAEKV